MTLIFNALQRLRRLGSVFGTLWVMAISLVLVACSSLPEGAAIPQLQIQKVAFDNQDKSNPHFVIEYTLNHASSTPLSLKALKANIFVKGKQAVAFTQKFDNLQIPPHDSKVLLVEVPVNMMSPSAIDSIANSKLLVLDGSCALQALFTDNPNEQAYNPSTSYVGLFHYINSDEDDLFKATSVRPNLNPQASIVPLPRPVKEEQPVAPTDANAANTASTTTPNATNNNANVPHTTGPDSNVNAASTGLPNNNAIDAPNQTAPVVQAPASAQTQPSAPAQMFSHPNAMQSNAVMLSPAQSNTVAPRATQSKVTPAAPTSSAASTSTATQAGLNFDTAAPAQVTTVESSQLPSQPANGISYESESYGVTINGAEN